MAGAGEDEPHWSRSALIVRTFISSSFCLLRTVGVMFRAVTLHELYCASLSCSTAKSAASGRAGRTRFHDLLYRREQPYFYAFDVLEIDGEDLTGLSLLKRKRRLRSVIPAITCRLLHLDSIAGRGTDLFRLACEQDLEGVVAKWVRGTYQCDDRTTSWIKIKNPAYSQAEGRAELFETRRDSRPKPSQRTITPDQQFAEIHSLCRSVTSIIAKLPQPDPFACLSWYWPFLNRTDNVRVAMHDSADVGQDMRQASGAAMNDAKFTGADPGQLMLFNGCSLRT